MRATPPASLSSFDRRAVAGLTLLGLVVRVVYVAAMTWSPSDPWRHLVLIRNLRAGLGFTPFPGEPYVWYQPPWHGLCAVVWPVLGPEWLAALFSLACVPATYLWLRTEWDPGGEARAGARVAAVGGGLLMAAWGPAVRFTCQYGSEAFALALLFGALLLALRRPGWPSAIAAGCAIGVALVCRLNFALAAPLFLPAALRRPGRAAVIVAVAAVPLGLAWLRNARLLAERAWVFTWDGLATPTDGFDVLSTFLVQRHPDVAEGLHRIHAMVFAAGPEWIAVPALLAFLLLAAAGLAYARRPWPALAAAAALVYLGLLDATGSGNFLRVWLGVFPALFAGIAIAAGRLWNLGESATAPSRTHAAGRVGAAVLLAVALALGAPYLRPPQGGSATLLGTASVPLEQVIPGPDWLHAEAYFVNSGFFHPESLIWAYPDKRFLGLPLEPDRFDAFQAAYPEVRHILWHEVGFQDDLRRWLVASGRYRVIREGSNGRGTRYTLLVATGTAPTADHGPGGPG